MRNKTLLSVFVPKEEFIKWFKTFAPELSPDGEILEVETGAKDNVIAVSILTDTAHWNAYKKQAGVKRSGSQNGDTKGQL